MNTVIVGTGSYLPERVLSSAELGERLGVGEQWILDKTGVKERRVAAPEQASSDLATQAALRALTAAGIDALDLDLVVVATASPDQPMPATACFVQHNIGATRAVAFDLNAACTGFVYALAIAHNMLTADPQRQAALIIGAEIYTRTIDYTDRSTCVLLGDGAGAVVLRKAENAGVLSTTLASDGALTGLAEIPAGGSRLPPSADTVKSCQHYLKMRGRAVRRIVADLLPDLVSDLLRLAGIGLADVDLVVPHQANGTMMAEWTRSLGLAPETVYQTVAWSGNTGAASVPIALDDAVRQDCISDGDILLLVAFGAGVTWGGMALKWDASLGCTRPTTSVT